MKTDSFVVVKVKRFNFDIKHFINESSHRNKR